MNYKPFFVPLMALTVLAASACAPTSSLQKSEMSSDCSKSKSAANNADCSGGSDLGPPVVDISKPAPAPGVSSPK